MTKTDYGLMHKKSWLDGQPPKEIPDGCVALHDGDVATHVYDVLGDVEAWKEWARMTFERSGPIAIAGSEGQYQVEKLRPEIAAGLEEFRLQIEEIRNSDDIFDAVCAAAVEAWRKTVETPE